MRLWPKRKTDAKFVERSRKTLVPWRLWFAKLFAPAFGLFIVGAGAWYSFKCFEVASILRDWLAPWLTAEANESVEKLLDLVMETGSMAGFYFGMGLYAVILFPIIVPGLFRTRRLMLKYHDALLANGIPPNEPTEAGEATGDEG